MKFGSKNATMLFAFIPFINIIIFKFCQTLEVSKMINTCTDSGAFYTMTALCMTSYLFYGFILINRCISMNIIYKIIYIIGMIIMSIGNIPSYLIDSKVILQLIDLLLHIGIMSHVSFIYHYFGGFCSEESIECVSCNK